MKSFFVKALDGLKSDVYYYGKRREKLPDNQKGSFRIVILTETPINSTMKLVIFISLVSVATFAEALKEGDCEGKF